MWSLQTPGLPSPSPNNILRLPEFPPGNRADGSGADPSGPLASLRASLNKEAMARYHHQSCPLSLSPPHLPESGIETIS